MYMEQLTQALSVAGTEIDPVSQAAGTVTGGGVDMSKFHRVLWVLLVGSVGAAGTVDAKLQESATVGGAYTDIAGGGITQITAGNKIATLEVRADQMTKQFCRLSVTVGVNAVLIAALPLAGEAVDKPGKAQDIAAVTQRLTV